MPLYAIHALDGPGGADKRTAHFAAHLDHVEANIDRYFVSGPMLPPKRNRVYSTFTSGVRLSMSRHSSQRPRSLR